MGIPHPSFLYGESTEPPKVPLPLEARKVHFCCSPLPRSQPRSNTHSNENVRQWAVRNPDGFGTLIPTAYAFRHDMIRGGHHAQTATEGAIDRYIQTMVLRGGKLEGWLPRIENFRGNDHCFDVIFLRPKTFGCTRDVKVSARAPEHVAPTLEPQPQEHEAPETVPARDHFSGTHTSPAEDTTSEDGSDYWPPTAHTERETRIRRVARSRAHMETRARLRQMRRDAEARDDPERTRWI